MPSDSEAMFGVMPVARLLAPQGCGLVKLPVAPSYATAWLVELADTAVPELFQRPTTRSHTPAGSVPVTAKLLPLLRSEPVCQVDAEAALARPPVPEPAPPDRGSFCGSSTSASACVTEA